MDKKTGSVVAVKKIFGNYCWKKVAVLSVSCHRRERLDCNVSVLLLDVDIVVVGEWEGGLRD